MIQGTDSEMRESLRPDRNEYVKERARQHFNSRDCTSKAYKAVHGVYMKLLEMDVKAVIPPLLQSQSPQTSLSDSTAENFRFIGWMQQQLLGSSVPTATQTGCRRAAVRLAHAHFLFALFLPQNIWNH